MDVDLQSLGPASVGAFEAALSTLSAALYLLAAVAVLAKAPRDHRSRLFLLIAITNVMPYAASVLFWYRGAVTFTKPLLLAVALSFAVGSVALFHFSQLFPWRRPWIRGQTAWLTAAYLACPLLTMAVMNSASTPSRVSTPNSAALRSVGLMVPPCRISATSPTVGSSTFPAVAKTPPSTTEMPIADRENPQDRQIA